MPSLFCRAQIVFAALVFSTVLVAADQERAFPGAEGWAAFRKFENGKLEIVGNVMLAGPNTQKNLPLLILEGIGDVDVRAVDNLNRDRDGQPVRITGANPAAKGKIVEHAEPVFWPPGLVALPVAQVEESVYQNAGARPWDRDAIDERIVRETRARTGRIIDSEQEVGGYPVAKETRRPFNPDEWDLRTMARRK